MATKPRSSSAPTKRSNTNVNNGVKSNNAPNGAASKSTARNAVSSAPASTRRTPGSTATPGRKSRQEPIAFPVLSVEEQQAAHEIAETRFWLFATVLLVLGIALRQFNLQAFPYHPDEAIHGWYAADFNGYNYDPVYHGPLLYHLNALIMRLAGANDYTARLAPSLLGIGLLALVVGPARKFLGREGALWSLGLLALSPVAVTYARRNLHDSLVMLLTLGLVLCFQTSRERGSGTRGGGWARVGILVLSALFLATKANVFFILAMLMAFWVAELLGSWNRVASSLERVPPMLWRCVPMGALLLIGLTSHLSSHPVLLPDGQTYGEAPGFLFPGKVLTVMCVLACGALFAWLLVGPRATHDDSSQASFPGTPNNERAHRHSPWPYLLGGVAACVAFTFLYGHGYKLFGALSFSEWKTAYWPDVTSAMPRLVEYWGGQQGHPRLAGRHDYYIVMLVLYELPILLLFLAGLWRASKERTPFSDLLVWWSVTSFALYSLANEKMPWLMTHLVLPMALLGAWWAARTFADTIQNLKTTRQLPTWALPTVAGLSALYLLRGTIACNFERAADHHEPMFYAQTTETFRDALFKGLQDTDPATGSVWVDSGAQNGKPDKLASAQWPCAWYLRSKAPLLRGSTVAWGDVPDAQTRVIVTSPERWAQVQSRYPNWNAQKTEFYIWSRPSWPALRPDNWLKFWLLRTVNNNTPPNNGLNGLLESGEWSDNYITVASPPFTQTPRDEILR